MTRVQKIILIFLVASFIAGLVTGNKLYYRLSYLWLLLIFINWFLAASGLWGIEFRRSARISRSQVGMIFEEKYEVINKGRLTKFMILVRDESNLPNSKGSHLISMLHGGEKRIYFARSFLFMRGVFPLGPTTLISSDFLGLFRVKKTFPSESSLIVLPIMFEILNFPNPQGVLMGGESRRVKTEQITPNISGIREYQPGDPLNRIHWLSTAHRNRLIAKEFELDPLSDVWIFLDSQKEAHCVNDYETPPFDPYIYWTKAVEYHLPPSTVEYSVSIAASLTRYYLKKGRAVGIAFYDTKVKVLPADRSTRQLNKILEILALFDASSSMSYVQFVEFQSRHLSRGSTIVMITPNNSKSIINAVDLLLRRGLNPIVILIERSSFTQEREDINIIPFMDVLNVPYRLVRKNDILSDVISGKTIRKFSSVLN